MEKVLVGKIVNTHGIKGLVKVKSFCEVEENLFSYENIMFENGQKVNVEKKSNGAKGLFICSVGDFDNINDVEIFKGKDLFVAKSDIKGENSQSEIFVEDLKGLKVVVDGKVFGNVLDVLNFGAGDLLEIVPVELKNAPDNVQKKKSHLVPFSGDAVEKVDLENGKVFVNKGFI